ncbi:MAG: hypothetical protein V3R29_04345 [Candidatus Acidoferrales bacterium]
MCGIAGIFHPRPNETASHLRELLAAMQHRGPDGADMAIGRQVRTGWTLEEVQTDALRGTTFQQIRPVITIPLPTEPLIPAPEPLEKEEGQAGGRRS